MKAIRSTSKFVILLAIASLSFSCKDSKGNSNNGETQQLAFKNDLTDKVFQHYSHIRTALTNGNSEEAGKGAQMLSETISNNYVEVSKLSKEIAKESDIEKQKASFSKLTEAIQPVFESNISEGSLYKQYCPMALNNEGAYWFSASEAIENPYFEGKMLTCGSVKEVLE